MLADAGLEGEALAPERAGVAMGTTSGEPREVERFDDRYLAGELDRVGAEFISLYPCHMIAAHVARELGFAGPNAMIPTACAAGNYAIAHAMDVLRAMDLLLQRGNSRQSVHLLMVGDGLLKGACTEFAMERSLPVTFAGFMNQSEMPKAYAISDVLILPSESETWGLVVNEAMACGLPVVASDIPALDDQLDHGRGLRVPPRNADAFPRSGIWCDDALFVLRRP